jgi:hypothetical protein
MLGCVPFATLNIPGRMYGGSEKPDLNNKLLYLCRTINIYIKARSERMKLFNKMLLNTYFIPKKLVPFSTGTVID